MPFALCKLVIWSPDCFNEVYYLKRVLPEGTSWLRVMLSAFSWMHGWTSVCNFRLVPFFAWLKFQCTFAKFWCESYIKPLSCIRIHCYAIIVLLRFPVFPSSVERSFVLLTRVPPEVLESPEPFLLYFFSLMFFHNFIEFAIFNTSYWSLAWIHFWVLFQQYFDYFKSYISHLRIVNTILLSFDDSSITAIHSHGPVIYPDTFHNPGTN